MRKRPLYHLTFHTRLLRERWSHSVRSFNYCRQVFPRGAALLLTSAVNYPCQALVRGVILMVNNRQVLWPVRAAANNSIITRLEFMLPWDLLDKVSDVYLSCKNSYIINGPQVFCISSLELMYVIGNFSLKSFVSFVIWRVEVRVT